MVSFLEKVRAAAGLGRPCAESQRVPGAALKGANRPAFPDSGFDVEDLFGPGRRHRTKAGRRPRAAAPVLEVGRQAPGVNVDPKFANALDGLILVDLTKTEPKLLDRYLGKAWARNLPESHRNSYFRIGRPGGQAIRLPSRTAQKGLCCGYRSATGQANRLPHLPVEINRTNSQNPIGRSPAARFTAPISNAIRHCRNMT